MQFIVGLVLNFVNLNLFGAWCLGFRICQLTKLAKVY
jgi:hypothetical protein